MAVDDGSGSRVIQLFWFLSSFGENDYNIWHAFYQAMSNQRGVKINKIEDANAYEALKGTFSKNDILVFPKEWL